ncbi:MAG: DNA-processing protein DprA [Planctomycetes bacterium]|nr:DNA-processing protein DprA [Planctomycetota bacterium]
MEAIPVHLTCQSTSWPARLRGIPNPPSEIWLRGRGEWLEREPCIAIVGSRSASGYGLDQAARFAHALAKAGFVIISGMARGIDQAAHAGALAAGGGTIAVLGNGVSDPWPRWSGLADLIERGLLLSEFAPGQGPRRHHFPLRNRLIAALADAVLVVEAAHASGSLITAHWALDMGREVFALPGRVDHAMASGTLRLLREGARAVGSPGQLLADLSYETPTGLGGSPVALPRPEDADAARIFDALEGETLDINDLAARTGLPIPATMAHMAQLELAGLVLRGPGGLYRRPVRDG